MKLIIVSEFFYPYKTSTQKIMTELSEDFVKYGAEVEVLTTNNAYREKKVKLKRREVYEGIKIKRIFSTSGNRDNKLFRILNYVTFLNSLLINLLFKNDYDKVLFVSNPPLAPYIGYIIKKIKKKDYFYLVHDIYPDVAEKLGVIKKNGFIYKVMDYINNKIYCNAKGIVVLGEDMKRVLIKKNVDTNKINIITNWADSSKVYNEKVDKEFYNKYKLDGKFNILYTGNISKVHAIESILDVAKKLESNEEIKFTFVGDGNKRQYIQDMIDRKDISNVQIIDYVFGDEYNKLLNCADSFITTLQEGIEGLGVPSKTYTYMAIGKPIIAIMSEDSEIGKMVNDYKLGIQALNDYNNDVSNFILDIKENRNLYNEIVDKVNLTFKMKYERKKVTKAFFEIIK